MLPTRWRSGQRLKACEISAYVSGGAAGTGPTYLGGAPTYYGGVTPVVPSASPPGGVSLQQIDGGPNYYCSSGLAYACNAGWDNFSFFPILDDYAFYATNSTATFKALGLITAVRVTCGTNMNYLRSAGVTAIQAGDETTNTGSETVGAHIEEPGSWTDITSQAKLARRPVRPFGPATAAILHLLLAVLRGSERQRLRCERDDEHAAGHVLHERDAGWTPSRHPHR